MDSFELLKNPRKSFPAAEFAMVEEGVGCGQTIKGEEKEIIIKEEPVESDGLSGNFEQKEEMVFVKDGIQGDTQYLGSETAIKDEEPSASSVLPSTSDFLPLPPSERINSSELVEMPLMDSKRKVSTKKLFTCHFCGKDLPCKRALNQHIVIHTGEKLFSCEICNKGFSQKNNLNIHMRIHTGEKPFSCEICNKSFAQKAHLTYHLHLHSGQKPFSCKICNKSFAQKAHLTYHLHLHSGEKPFSCEHCNKSFIHKSNLNLHMRIHTGEKPFSCDHCNKRFSRKDHLMIHITSHLGASHLQEKRFSSESFANKCVLNKHFFM